MVMETRERQRQRQGGPQMPRTAKKISAKKIEAGMKEMGVVIESSEKVNDALFLLQFVSLSTGAALLAA